MRGFQGSNVPGMFAQMFFQVATAANIASDASQQSMENISTAVESQGVPAIQTLGTTFQTTGKTASNSMLQIGQMINQGLIPPIQGVGIATIDASALLQTGTQQMTNSFGQTGNYLQGSFIPIIGQQIPTAGNTAAQGIGQSTNGMNNMFGQLGSYLQNQFIPTINPQIPSAGNSSARNSQRRR